MSQKINLSVLWVCFLFCQFTPGLCSNQACKPTKAKSVRHQLSEIEKSVTPPVEFTLESPRITPTSRIVKVEEYGLRNSNTPDENANALERISAAISNTESITLLFPENEVYTVAVKKGRKLLDIINTSDLLVEGNNSRIKFLDAEEPVRGKGFFYIDNSQRVTLRNISIGCDWAHKPLAMIGKLVHFNEERNEGSYQLISNGKLSDNTQLWAAQEWDPIAKTRTIEGIASNFSSYTIEAPDRVRVVFSNRFTPLITGKYSLISIRQNTQYSGIVLENNDHILIENVKFLGIPFMAIEGRDRGMTEHLIVRNCTLAPPEPDTYFSAGEGFDVRSSWYICENNTMEYCYDDIMNFDAGIIGAFLAGGLVRETNLKPNELIADHLQYYFTKNVLQKGRKFGIADQNFKPLEWESTLIDFEYQLNYHKNHPAAHRCILRFKDDIPPGIKENFILYGAANEEGGYIIRNNVIRNSIRHAIWAGNSNGLIENNLIYQSGYPAIMVQMTSRWDRWFKGYYPANVTIRNNKVINCNTTLRQPATIFVGGGYDTERYGFTPVEYPVTSNIIIEGNEITGSYQAALGVWSAKNIIIRNNLINGAFKHPLSPNNQGNGAIFIKNSENVFILNNKLQYSEEQNKPPRLQLTDNKNITFKGNSGF